MPSFEFSNIILTKRTFHSPTTCELCRGYVNAGWQEWPECADAAKNSTKSVWNHSISPRIPECRMWKKTRARNYVQYDMSRNTSAQRKAQTCSNIVWITRDKNIDSYFLKNKQVNAGALRAGPAVSETGMNVPVMDWKKSLKRTKAHPDSRLTNPRVQSREGMCAAKPGA